MFCALVSSRFATYKLSECRSPSLHRKARSLHPMIQPRACLNPATRRQRRYRPKAVGALSLGHQRSMTIKGARGALSGINRTDLLT